MRTYRIEEKGTFTKLSLKESRTRLFWQDKSQPRGRRKDGNLKRRTKMANRYMKASIRSKNHLCKMLKSLPVPRIFTFLLLLTLLCLGMEIIAALVNHLLFTNVFSWLGSQLSQLSSIAVAISRVYESTIWLAQADRLNQYISEAIA